jgi:hypothetical protein
MTQEGDEIGTIWLGSKHLFSERDSPEPRPGVDSQSVDPEVV